MKLNTIHLGNTFSLIKEIEPNSIDLIICDGPYGVTKWDWDKIPSIQEYNLSLIREFERVLKPGGSLYLFGKHDCIDFIDYRPYLKLKTRIQWYLPGGLSQGRKKLTDNYDTLAYFSKGEPSTFNLDEVRVPQLVSKKQQKRVESVPSVLNGKYSKTKYNESGKNPGNLWADLKQLTYKSKELVGKKHLNTIQKPESIMERLINLSSNKGDIVLDPFCGLGTVPAVCKRLERNFIAFEINPEFIDLSEKRCKIGKYEEKLKTNNLF